MEELEIIEFDQLTEPSEVQDLIVIASGNLALRGAEATIIPGPDGSIGLTKSSLLAIVEELEDGEVVWVRPLPQQDLTTESVEQTEFSIAGGLVMIDPMRHQLKIDGELVNTSQAEFATLLMFARNIGRVMSYEELMEKLKMSGSDGGKNALRTHVARLKKRLGENSDLISNVRGFGYILNDPSEE